MLNLAGPIRRVRSVNRNGRDASSQRHVPVGPKPSADRLAFRRRLPGLGRLGCKPVSSAGRGSTSLRRAAEPPEPAPRADSGTPASARLLVRAAAHRQAGGAHAPRGPRRGQPRATHGAAAAPAGGFRVGGEPPVGASSHGGAQSVRGALVPLGDGSGGACRAKAERCGRIRGRRSSRCGGGGAQDQLRRRSRCGGGE
jgi:hypothetical protein